MAYIQPGSNKIVYKTFCKFFAAGLAARYDGLSFKSSSSEPSQQSIKPLQRCNESLQVLFMNYSFYKGPRRFSREVTRKSG